MFSKFAAIAIAICVISPASALAIPAFSKKYESPCVTCHTVWPKLNGIGMKFKQNGYQMPGTEDGGEASKLKASENLFLNVGSANPPISVRLEGGLTALQPSDGPDGKQAEKIFCCVDGNAVSVQVGGTIAPNIGYYISLPWEKDSAEQAYLRFVNIMGAGLLGIDVGVMKVVDYDVTGVDRRWFSTPNVALFGSPFNNNGLETGMTANHNDTGLRLYGRPDYSSFSYEAAIYTGAQVTDRGEDDSKFAYTMMGRMDMESVAFSARYWSNESGAKNVTASASDGSAINFLADMDNVDEKTEQFTLSARYVHQRFEADLTIDSTTFSVGDRTATDADGTAYTLSQGSQDRMGVSLGVIWFINSWFNTGINYGLVSQGSYTQTVNGTQTEFDSKSVALFQWKLEVQPAMNMRFGLEINLDMSENDSRYKADGDVHSAQNKILLSWDMAI